MSRVVQVLITHISNDAFTTDVDEYVKKFTRSAKMILYDASYSWHVASKKIVAGKFLLFQVTEYVHVRPYTFLESKVLYLTVVYPFERQVAYCIR